MFRYLLLLLVVLGLLWIATVDYTAVLAAAFMVGITLGRVYWSPRYIGG